MKTAGKIFVIILALGFFACGNSGKLNETPTRGNIKISVDESYKLLMDSEIDTFEAIYAYAIINQSYKPEVSCFEDLINDSVRLIVVNRKLNDAEDQNLRSKKLIPRTTEIAHDAIAFIINRENPDSIFTFEQLQEIFNGKISDWSGINKNSTLGKLSVVFDNNKSGNPRYIKETFRLQSNFPDYCYAVNSNEEVINYVEKNIHAIGIVSVNWISDKNDTLSNKFLHQIKVARVSGEGNTEGPFLKPYQAYVADGSYPFTRDVYIISREYFAGLGTGFASFVAGDQGQRIVLKSGLVPAAMPVRLVEIKK